jgi:hypothetical protein
MSFTHCTSDPPPSLAVAASPDGCAEDREQQREGAKMRFSHGSGRRSSCPRRWRTRRRGTKVPRRKTVASLGLRQKQARQARQVPRPSRRRRRLRCRSVGRWRRARGRRPRRRDRRGRRPPARLGRSRSRRSRSRPQLLLSGRRDRCEGGRSSARLGVGRGWRHAAMSPRAVSGRVRGFAWISAAIGSSSGLPTMPSIATGSMAERCVTASSGSRAALVSHPRRPDWLGSLYEEPGDCGRGNVEIGAGALGRAQCSCE